MPDTKINIQAATQCQQMQVQGLPGIPSRDLDCQSADKRWKISVPREAFSVLTANPGDTLIVSVSIVRIGIDEALPEALAGKLILPRPN